MFSQIAGDDKGEDGYFTCILQNKTAGRMRWP